MTDDEDDDEEEAGAEGEAVAAQQRRPPTDRTAAHEALEAMAREKAQQRAQLRQLGLCDALGHDPPAAQMADQERASQPHKRHVR